MTSSGLLGSLSRLATPRWAEGRARKISQGLNFEGEGREAYCTAQGAFSYRLQYRLVS